MNFSKGLAIGLAAMLTAESTGAAGIPMPMPFPQAALHRMPQPAAMPEARPAPAKAKETFRLHDYARDLRDIKDWVLERFFTPPPVKGLRTMPRARGKAVIAAEPASRILVKREAGFDGASAALGAALSLAERPAYIPAKRYEIQGTWWYGRGLRLRVNYFDAVGSTLGMEGGFDLFYYGERRWVPAKDVPRTLRREAPVYLDRSAPYEIELEAKTDLPALEITAIQRETDGTALTKPVVFRSKAVKAGETIRLRASTPLLGSRRNAINFEFTHVRVDEAGDYQTRPLADIPEAGVIDPPNP